MGSNNVNLGHFVEEQDSAFTQASYLGHGSYDDHIPETTYQHVFSSNNIFPDLNEYSKVNVTGGLNRDDLAFTQEAMATLRLVETGGSFKNVVGHYVVGEDGTIRDVTIAFRNTRSAEPGLTHSFNVSGNNGSLNFFIVAHGYSMNREFSALDDTDGDFSFVYKQGSEDERPAQITDQASDITLIYQTGDGKVSKIRGPIYHSTQSDKEHDLNTDGENHTVSGISKDDGDQSVLRIGFEDFPGLGDADYNDVVFDLSVSYLHPDFTDKHLVVSSLNDLMPSSGQSHEGLQEEKAPDERTDGSGSKFENNHGSSLNNYNGSTESDFDSYAMTQMSKFLPDLYNEIKTALSNSYDTISEEKFAAVFAEFLKSNYRDIYNELLSDFDQENLTTQLAAGDNQDITDILISTDHIDEAINNFITAGSEAESTVANANSPDIFNSPISDINMPDDYNNLINTGDEIV